MDWFQFIASMTGSLAWPVSAAMIALIFRGQIKAVFSRLEELGYGDWKLKLRKDFDEAEQAAAELPPPPPLQDPEPQPQIEAPRSAPVSRFEELVAVSPNAAILDSWLEIEGRLRVIAAKVEPSIRLIKGHRQLIDTVAKQPFYPPSLRDLLHEMREIRNTAAHSARVSVEDAYRFKRLADQVMPFLVPNSIPKR